MCKIDALNHLPNIYLVHMVRVRHCLGVEDTSVNKTLSHPYTFLRARQEINT